MYSVQDFKTTFWSDFSIADRFGNNAIQDTFDRAFNEWKTDYIYLTELVIVLNWKMWDYYKKDTAKAMLYNKLYEQASLYAEENLQGEQLKYYYNMTD